MTTAQFIDAVMQGLGVSGQNARAFFTGLAAAEGTKARNNPFATTRVIGNGETVLNGNPHGVKNYATAADGIKATVETFQLGYYKEVRRLMRENAPVKDIARALSNSPYVGGSQAVRDRHAANIVRNAQNLSYESPALKGNTENVALSSQQQLSPEQIIANNALGGAKWTDLGGVAAHRSRPLGNWQSDNAFDLGVPVGTPVYAIEDGIVGPGVGVQSSRPNDSKRLTLNGSNNNFWYGHLSEIAVKAGQQVKKGDLLGYSGKSQNGVAHLHVGVENLGAIPSIAGDSSQGGGTPLDVPQSTDQPVVFPFEDPQFQVPFEEPGTQYIGAPNRNYAETWKIIGNQPYSDPLTKQYGDYGAS